MMTATAMSACPSHDEVRQALERLLSSRRFARAERHARFLRFVVEETLNGNGYQLKESLLGTEVFGRSPGYDPRVDPVVRVEATKLRGRLEEYYRLDAPGETIVIDFPRGGYVPQFRYREVAPVADAAAATGAAGANSGDASTTSPVEHTQVSSVTLPEPNLERHRWMRLAYAIAAAGLVALGVWAWIGGHQRPVTNDHVIAVLPLEDLTTGQFGPVSEALTAELRTRLSKGTGVRVVSKTSSRAAVKGQAGGQAVQDAPSIGRELGADLLLEGSLRPLHEGEAARLAVMLQLVDARSGLVVWTGRYECAPSLWDEPALESMAGAVRSAARGRGV